MKKIILILSFFLLISFQVKSNELKLQEVIKDLDSPWSLSFINENLVLVTEKSGSLVLVDFETKKATLIFDAEVLSTNEVTQIVLNTGEAYTVKDFQLLD